MLILRPLFLGIIAALSALILEVFFLFSPELNLELIFQKISWLLVIFILIEEIIKITFIWKNFSEMKNIRSKKEIFFQTLFIGLGFALTETTIKIFASSPPEFISYSPLAGAAIIHIGTAGLIGYFLTMASKINFPTLFKILLVSSGWHFLYNILVIYAIDFKIISLLSFILMVFVFGAYLKINRVCTQA